ncbi:MAG: ABC-2 transporter permease [Clostridia bacterium]|nr:ABC-2 transporter permease [Clostridia bacterium]
MLKLAWKDLYANRSQLLLPIGFAGAVLVIAVVSRRSDALMFVDSLMGTYSMLIGPFFALASMMLEEKNRTLGFLRTMPVNAGEIVASKFVSTLAATAILAVSFIGLSTLSAEAFPAWEGRSWSMLGITMSMFVSLAEAGVALGISFKWGTSAARAAIMVMVTLFYLGPIVVLRKGASIEDIFRMITNPDARTALIVAAVSLAIYFAEMLVAQELFRRKEIA